MQMSENAIMLEFYEINKQSAILENELPATYVVPPLYVTTP